MKRQQIVLGVLLGFCVGGCDEDSPSMDADPSGSSSGAESGPQTGVGTSSTGSTTSTSTSGTTTDSDPPPGGGEDTTGDDDPSGSTGDDGEIEYTTWPESAEEALSRSPYWDPSLQVLHEGTLETTEPGQLIENLHIVDGELVVAHDNVVVRNVTVEAQLNEDAGNHGVHLTDGAQGVTFDGILMGPAMQSWDPGCNMPMFPASGFLSDSDASWTVRGCATRHVGDAVKVNGGTGVFEDCFFELAMGIWAVEPCEPDHTDTLQINGGSPTVTFRRIWMDALRHVVNSPNGTPAPAQSPGGATHLQLSGGASDVTLVYDTVRLFSGNFTFRIFRTLHLSITNSHAEGYTYGPFLVEPSNNLTVGEWNNNTLEGGEPWTAP